MHFYPTKIFEIVRVAYLLSNGKAVVSECGPDTAIDSDIREGVAAVPYEDLHDTCLRLVRDVSLRRALEYCGYNIIARRHLPDILARAIVETERSYRF